MESKGTLIRSIIGGFLIGIGGTAFLAVDNKVVGSVLFAVGLMSICVTEQLLFTGKTPYTMNLKNLFIILAGNFVGATVCGVLVRSVKPEFISKATDMCYSKLGEGTNVVILGLFCNILIYLALEGFKANYPILLIMAVSAFILCGFEHCIANMFYFAVAKIINVKYLVLNIFGNLLGGFLIYLYRIYKRKFLVNKKV